MLPLSLNACQAVVLLLILHLLVNMIWKKKIRTSLMLEKVQIMMMFKKLFLMIKVKFRSLMVSLKLQSLKKQELKAINRAMKKNKKNDKKKGKNK